MEKEKLKRRFTRAWKNVDSTFDGCDEKQKDNAIEWMINFYFSLRQDRNSGCTEREDFETALMETIQDKDNWEEIINGR